MSENENHESRKVRETVGGFYLYNGTRAREVVAEYEDGSRHVEIEVEVNGRYVPKYREINDD